MDTFRIILWIIGIVIYFVVQANKNKQKNTAKPKPVAGQQSKPEAKSFEELLKELQQGNKNIKVNDKNKKELERIKGQQPVLSTHNPGSFADEGMKDAEDRMKKVFDEKAQTIREITERRKQVEEDSLKSYDDDIEEYVNKYESTPVYEKEATKVNYENPASKGYKSLSSTKDRFDPFDEKKAADHPLLKMFQNPESLRNAFIMSEIFTRKE